MNLRRKLARLLGYGGIEWERSQISSLPVLIVAPGDYVPDTDFIPVSMYPGGVQVLPGEYGTNGVVRILFSPPNHVKIERMF